MPPGVAQAHREAVASTATTRRILRNRWGVGAVYGIEEGGTSRRPSGNRSSSPQRSEDRRTVDRIGGTAGHRRAHFGLVAAQERVGGEFEADRRRHCRFAAPARGFVARRPLAERRVAGLDREREADVRQGVLVGAVHAGRRRQRGQRIERRDHLPRRSLEQPATPTREQRVAAEQQRRQVIRGEVGDVARGVARHVDDPELAAEDIDAVAVAQARVDALDAFAGRAEDPRSRPRLQVEHAADVVAVVMGD